jgi:site-specific DNA recombinase
VIIYHTDRLTRQMKELVDWVEFMKRYGISVHSVTGGPYDLTTPDGKFRAHVFGAAAQFRRDQQSALIKRKLELERANGRASRGATPFGWRRVKVPTGDGRRTESKLELHPEQATLIRDATEQFLAGISLNEIARRWNASDIRPPRRALWTYQEVGKILSRYRDAGLLTYATKKTTPSGQEICDPDSEKILGPAEWDAIPGIGPEHIRAVRRVRAENATKWAPRERTRGTHLLAGIAVCGVCGTPVRSGARSAGRRDHAAIYRCRARYENPGQHTESGHVTRAERQGRRTRARRRLGRTRQSGAAGAASGAAAARRRRRRRSRAPGRCGPASTAAGRDRRDVRQRRPGRTFLHAR